MIVPDEITVSFSELDTYRQCPMKWKLAYEDRWSRPKEDMSALNKGTCWHIVMEAHYRTIMAHQIEDLHGNGEITWDVTTDELLALCQAEVQKIFVYWVEQDLDEELMRLIAWMYAGYIDRYKLDDQWDIVEVEGTHIVDLVGGVRLKVKLDLIVRDERGKLWVIDHKSCANLPRESDFDFNDQFGLYVAALEKIGLKIMGAMHSAARTTMNQGDRIAPNSSEWKKSMRSQSLDERFSRTQIGYTTAQLSGILEDARADAVLMYSNHNHRRRHMNDVLCKRRCDFSEACIYGRRTGKDADTIDMLQRTGFEQDFTRH